MTRWLILLSKQNIQNLILFAITDLYARMLERGGLVKPTPVLVTSVDVLFYIQQMRFSRYQSRNCFYNFQLSQWCKSNFCTYKFFLWSNFRTISSSFEVLFCVGLMSISPLYMRSVRNVFKVIWLISIL